MGSYDYASKISSDEESYTGRKNDERMISTSAIHGSSDEEEYNTFLNEEIDWLQGTKDKDDLSQSHHNNIHIISKNSINRGNQQYSKTNPNSLPSKTQKFIQADTISKLQKCNQFQTNHNNNCTPSSITKSIRTIANSIIYDSTQTVSKVLRGDVSGHVPADIYGQTTHEEITECQSIYQQDYNHDDHIINQHNHNDDILPNQNVLLDLIDKIHKNKQTYNPSYDDDDQNNNEEKSYHFFDNEIHERKLYGGAQYHRLLQSYHQLFLTTPISQMTDEEISLLIHGISDSKHDGSDLLRSVAILSSKRMDDLARNVLKSLARQIEFVLGCRMWNVIEYTMITRTLDLSISNVWDDDRILNLEIVESLERDFILFVKNCYSNFVKEKVQLAFCQASGDIDAMMRFVNWDLVFSNGNVGGSLLSQSSFSSIPVQGNIVASSCEDEFDKFLNDEEEENEKLIIGTLSQQNSSIDIETHELLINIIKSVQNTSTLNTSPGHSLKRTYAAVNTLVQYVTAQWRREISRLVTTKFNSFCLVSFHDEFGPYLRQEMNRYLDDYINQLF